VGQQRLPLALVDLDAVDANVESLLGAVRGRGKTLRLATKSVRCPALIDYIVERGGEVMRGLMVYAAEEAAFLVERGHRDLLIAYPSVQESDAKLLAELNGRDGVRVSIVVDSQAQLDALDGHDVPVPVVIEVDMSLRPLGGRVHLGVRRSPLHSAEDVLRIARAVRARNGLRLAGVMGYEAQVAGVGEANPFSRALNPVRAMMKRASIPAVRRLRQQVADALAADGFEIDLFNGGGTGSLATTSEESAVTEVTAGSGFLCSHLFDYYPNLTLRPAAFFALQVFFRHAKAGELAEHFNEYLLVRGDTIVDRAQTYRGFGKAFL
jgi:D-serine deaminase-like pyridoxal phosphate-dependent protein